MVYYNLLVEFDKYIKLIKTPHIKNLVEYLLCKVPYDISKIPYNPSPNYQKVINGHIETIVDHSKRSCSIMQVMFNYPGITRMIPELSQINQDKLMASSILANSCRYGYPSKSDYTDKFYPTLVRQLKDEVIEFDDDMSKDFDSICTIIEGIRGPWTVKSEGTSIDPLSTILHIADYLAGNIDIG